MQKISFSLLLTGFIIIFNSLALSQQNVRDVVALKNGSVIKGIILEQSADSTIKIKTNGNIFVLDRKDIKEITKETYSSSQPEINPVESAEIKNDTSSVTVPEKIPASLTLLGGMALPAGDLSETDANPGYSLEAEGAFTIASPGFKAVLSLAWSSNKLGAPFDGGFSTVWLLPGIKLEGPVSRKVSLYGEWQLGVAFCSTPSLKYDYYSIASESASPFAFGIGFGMIANKKVNIGFRYFYAEPEFNKGGKLSVPVYRIIAGIQI